MIDENYIETDVRITGVCSTDEECLELSDIWFEDGIEDYISRLSSEHPDTELGGVLLGRTEQTDGGLKVVVMSALPAEHTQSSAVSLTFTHETWQEIYRVKDGAYPDLKIVGWFHSHPGLGVFMSPNDEFIHRNFFDLPWQIAYVIDPSDGRYGVFMWKKGKLVEVSR